MQCIPHSLDPNLTPLIDNDDVSSTNTNARVTFTLTTTGTWTAVANSLKASQSGAYTLTLTSTACPAQTSVPRRRAVGRRHRRSAIQFDTNVRGERKLSSTGWSMRKR